MLVVGAGAGVVGAAEAWTVMPARPLLFAQGWRRAQVYAIESTMPMARLPTSMAPPCRLCRWRVSDAASSLASWLSVCLLCSIQRHWPLWSSDVVLHTAVRVLQCSDERVCEQ